MNGADRISELPPFILHQILSDLPLKDSVRTSVLSKNWNSTYKSFPILRFNQERYMSHSSDKRLGDFIDVVDKSLQSFAKNGLVIRTLDISGLYHIVNPWKPRLSYWIPLALRQSVSELTFKLHSNPKKFGYKVNAYPLRQTAFSVLANGAPSKFFPLRKLNLCNVVLSERIVHDITLNCPNLRHLALAGIRGMKSLEISGLQKLRSFIIEFSNHHREIQRISVNAPSLNSFSHVRSKGQRRCEIDLSACVALTGLCLNRCSVMDDERFHRFVAGFSLLEVLEISLCNNLRSVRVSLPRLKLLEMDRCHKIAAVHIDAPMLSSFIYKSTINYLPAVTSPGLDRCDVELFNHMGPQSTVIIDNSWLTGLKLLKGMARNATLVTRYY